MEIIEKNITDLREYENNPRNNDGAVAAVAESIAQFGFKVPIVIDGDGVIVAGHTRKKAAERLGLATVPCIVADDLTPAQVAAFRLADNKTGELATWDLEALQVEIDALAAFDVDLSAFGFDEAIFDDMDAYIFEEDEAPEVEEESEPITQLGDVWQLGKHRLICGDSTDAVTVSRLMDGEQADLFLTDPPYNVAYESADGKTIQNDDMSGAQFFEFLRSAFAAADSVMREGAAFYIWHADTEGLNFRSAAEATGWKVRQCLVWNKNAFVMGRQDYQWKHEPCLYGWKDGAAHYFIDDRTQSTVINENKPKRNAEHPTMKPVELFARLILNSSKKGDIVLDTFGGSGTTLIACENQNRVCRIAELDPKYCDVIVKRWETLTGGKAQRL